ncbi:MAG: response regulator transcription factor [Saprospiraceae bacterium]|uniref:Response regulator transcription factor n=1 Tax=Candidatus Defluviibacterium haderslevense TaxID=2981993 RepID=A0A9D7SA85_9BACT|nr:response regulator transcription factor [Candidatus Defluviibacterium haderslevense]MCC7026543.1 response regulator transcription factor [Saprospiraceae bacterium]MBK7244443.1 response regulator transcription factor [Candidatus Defluviibacterium haderslevense]MBK8241821.1 response regulator transcription factor [Candidatus Defluviibacterium haderslevense]MBK8244810.1 response regulator transcription factor [Candidatus Defluviibacterium haderslevense]
MIRTIIVDDEPLAIEILEAYIMKMPNMNLIAKCSNALEANEVLRTEDIDLMFLDIEMPMMLGTDFLKSLKDPPQIIFTTAYPEFAVQGFELNALDYLLKPISLDRFIKAVNKVVVRYEPSMSSKEYSKSLDYIFVKADKKLIKINFSEIIYIEGLKDYVLIHTDQSRIITLQTMKSLEEKLPVELFIRAHRSYIVNLNRIKAIIGNTIEVLEKDQIKQLPIGKNYKDEIEVMIEKKRI